MVSAYALPTALLAPFLGPLSDRYGRRLVMLCSMSFFALTGVGTALAPSLGLLVILRVLNGLGAQGGFRLLGTWTAIVAVAAFVAASALLPRAAAAPRGPEPGVRSEDCIAECAPV